MDRQRVLLPSHDISNGRKRRRIVAVFQNVPIRNGQRADLCTIENEGNDMGRIVGIDNIYDRILYDPCR